MTQAVIFDCWGTLFTEEGENPYKILAEKLNYNLENYEFGKTVEKHFMLERHEGYEEPLRELFEDLNLECSEGLLEETKNILERGAKDAQPFPNTMKVLKDLKGKYRLGLISNTDYLAYQELEKKYGLSEIFDGVLTSFEAGIMKPNPKIFETMLNKLGVDKKEAVMVGDFLPDDIKAAEDYGMEGILIDRDNNYPNHPKRIKSLKELKDKL